MTVSMVNAGEQIPFEQWEGRRIVNDIIDSWQYPNQEQMNELVRLIPSLYGGLSEIEAVFSNAWYTGDTVHDYLPDNLRDLRDRIVDDLGKKLEEFSHNQI